jgi:hypothetical protein
MELSQLVQNLTLSGAVELAEEDKELKELLNTREALSILQQNTFKNDEWKRLTPISHVLPQASSLEELQTLYQENFVTNDLYFKRNDWLKVVLRVGDYETLKQIVGMHEAEVITLSIEEIQEIQQNVCCYPLSVFKVLFRILGTDDMVISVLDYKNFRVSDKERRILPFVGRIKNREKVGEVAFSTAPKVFAKLGVAVPQTALGLVDLGEFQNIEKSLFSVLTEDEATREIKQFAASVVADVLKRKVPFLDRERAWQFLSSYVKEDDVLFDYFRSLETPDNRLWIASRIP